MKFTKLATFSNFHVCFLQGKTCAQNIFGYDVDLVNWMSGRQKRLVHESKKVDLYDEKHSKKTLELGKHTIFG